jgi:purine nucleosidase
MSEPRWRVIIDNDFAGDPDGLVQLAHHVLCTSVEVVLVIASRLPDYMVDAEDDPTAEGAQAANDVLELAGSDLRAMPGSPAALVAGEMPFSSGAAEAIVTEAMRDDTELTLYYAAGGGLTELAAALQIEPAIAERLTLVWIGGHGYDSAAEGPEFNTSADLVAAQNVFGSRLSIWQVPEPAYAQCIVSWAELERDIAPLGPLGRHLVGRWRDFTRRVEEKLDVNLGECVILGDSPLVLLTALQASFRPEPTSSPSQLLPRLAIRENGTYGEPLTDLPPVRVFTAIDTRLMYGDLIAKLAKSGPGAARAVV